MISKNITVDDILNEMKFDSCKNTSKPVTISEMDHVDEMIKDILIRRQDRELGKERKEITLREKKQLEDELKEQTKSLTAEFNVLKKLQPDFKLTYDEKTQSENEHKAAMTGEIKVLPVAREQKLKYRDTSEVELPAHYKDKKEQKRKELQKTANEQHLMRDMKNITNHFGTDKNDEPKQANPIKTDISPLNYQELKTNRNKKVESFVIDHKKPNSNPNTEDVAAEEFKLNFKKRNETEQENENAEDIPAKKVVNIHNTAAIKRDNGDFTSDIQQENEYEYLDKSQNDEVKTKLIATQKSIFVPFVALGILLIPSIALFFLKFNTGEAGGFSVGVGIFAMINMALLLVAAVFSFQIFSNAIQSISERKPDKDILYSLMLIVSIAANAAICLQPLKLAVFGVAIYTPMTVMLLFVNFWSKYISIKKIIKNFEFISNDEEKSGILPVSDIKTAVDMTKGSLENEPELVKNVKIGFFKGFLSNSFQSDLSDIISTKIAIYALPAAIILAGISFLLTKEIYVSITVVSGTMLMLTSFIGAIFVTFPINDTAEVVNHFSGMMPEYGAINRFKNANAIMLDATDLFPPASIVLHGIKTFQGGRIDDAIIDAASVVTAANSVLSGVFLSIINDNKELLRPVDTIIYEDLMGLSAWVDGKRVLIGSRELMINHSIAVPKAEYEEKYHKEGNEVVFLSNGGELCAAFIIKFEPDRVSEDIVNLLAKNDIVAVVKSVDACVTSKIIAKTYDSDADLFKILPSRLHKSFDSERMPLEKADSILGNNGSVFGYIVSIVACKKLSYCMKLGSFMYIISSVLGVLFLFSMTLLNTFGVMGNLQMFIFMAAFAVAFWIYEKNMKL